MEEIKTADALCDKELLQQLRENNPFASSASPLPWNNANPDLGSLNREATEAIEQLIREKRREPSMPLAGLILGEAGSGKTHMLMRILRRMRENGQIAVFVTVRTFRDPDSVMGHLLTETLISLSREHHTGCSQLDMLMEELDSACQERCREEGFEIQQGLNRLRVLRTQMPGIDKGFLKCLLLYAEASSADMKMELLDWLRSGLDDEDSLRLGLPSRDLDSMTEAKREADAERILLSIGQVLACAKVPMIICFDQLDSMDSRELIIAWGHMLDLLINNLKGALPLAFLRADTWNNRFTHYLDDSIVHRMTGRPPIVIGNCSLEQAKQLIRHRIRAIFSNKADRINSWILSRLEGKLHAGYSPRSVINLTNQVIAEATPHSVSEPVLIKNRTMEAAYREECDKIRMVSGDWPPNAENLLLALGTWLDSQEDFDVKPCKDKYIQLMGTKGKNACAFIVIASKSHLSAGAALQHGINFLKEKPGGVCYYVTDGRTHKGPGNWKAVHQLIEQLTGLGGRIIVLDEEERAQWYGLVALLNKLDNGDVTLSLSSGQRNATRDDLRRYMKESFSVDFLKMEKPRRDNAESNVSPYPSREEGAQSPAPDDETLLEALTSLLDASPMKLLPAEKILEMLKARNSEISYPRLLSCVKRFQDRFYVYQAGKDTLIQRAGL
ncbi:MAG: ATP-binding protein [Fretibacterium sp.]|nr:ATP-binding protein [Fretibacterium sp.]